MVRFEVIRGEFAEEQMAVLIDREMLQSNIRILFFNRAGVSANRTKVFNGS